MLGQSLKNGCLVYEQYGKEGRVIFSVRELKEGRMYYTENGTPLLRTFDHQILLGFPGDQQSLAIPEEEDFYATNGILTFVHDRNGAMKPILLGEDHGQMSAEEAVQRLTSAKFFEGIPMRRRNGRGGAQKGFIAFSLEELPIGHTFICGNRTTRITRITAKICDVNGLKYKMADTRQTLPPDSSILDLAFPPSPATVRRNSFAVSENGMENGHSPKRDVEFGEYETAKGVEEIKDEDEFPKIMMQKFEEKLTEKQKRHSWKLKKQQKLSFMMEQIASQYDIDSKRMHLEEMLEDRIGDVKPEEGFCPKPNELYSNGYNHDDTNGQQPQTEPEKSIVFTIKDEDGVELATVVTTQQ